MTTIRIAIVTVFVAGLLWIPSAASAGGFSQPLLGAQSAGTGGAVTGRADVPEAGFYNPAGWTLQRDWGAAIGGSAMYPIVVHRAGDGTQTSAEVEGSYPPFLHAYGAFGDLAAGLSIDVPFGAGVQWPEQWEGRFEATATRLQAFEAAPAVAWRPIDEFAVGAGPRLLWAQLGFEQFRDFAQDDQEGFVELNASGVGVGAQVGAWGAVHDHWTVGASWRSASTVELEGMAHFEDIPPEMQHLAHDTPASTTMALPHRFAAGFAYDMPVMGRLSVDVEYTLWSSNDEFVVDFESDDIDAIEQQRNWGNTFSMRAGVESLPVIQGLVLRSGLAYEPSPAPREAVTAAQPTTDRMITSLGAGYIPFDGVEIDAAYNFMLLDSTVAADDGLSGTYGGQVHAFTLGVYLRPEIER